jgi:hypothetical protein
VGREFDPHRGLQLSRACLKVVMVLFRTLTLLGCLILGSCAAKFQVAELPPVEYNVGMCGDRTFSMVHALFSADGKSLDFAYRLKNSTEVVKNKGNQHVVFAVDKKPKDEDGDISFSSQVKYDKHVLTLDGVIRGDRFAALLKVDGVLGHAVYGEIGKLEDMKSAVFVDALFCADLRGAGVENIPKILAGWLLKINKEDSKLDKS